MELKHLPSFLILNLEGLLIVPYGIETRLNLKAPERLFLLIVPYGIETAKRRRNAGGVPLLIVPYGIETN